LALLQPVTDLDLQGGFAAQAKNWTWPIRELLWISSFAFIVLVLWLPETSAQTILYKRARRIRRLTGDENYYSDSERKQADMSASAILFESLLRPFQLMLEPAVLYVNIYIALAYAIFYCEYHSLLVDAPTRC
jgi:DHA1 family multidrug resistance protein-like MFS transporter